MIHDQQDRFLPLVAERFEGIDRGARARDGRLAVGHDEEDDVRGVEQRERLVGEPCGRVDDDEVVVLRKQLHRGGDVDGGHQLGLLRPRRPEEHLDTARPLPENLGQRRAHPLPGRKIDDRPRGRRDLEDMA